MRPSKSVQCIMINCVLVSTFIVLVTLTLHTPQHLELTGMRNSLVQRAVKEIREPRLFFLSGMPLTVGSMPSQLKNQSTHIPFTSSKHRIENEPHPRLPANSITFTNLPTEVMSDSTHQISHHSDSESLVPGRNIPNNTQGTVPHSTHRTPHSTHRLPTVTTDSMSVPLSIDIGSKVVERNGHEAPNDLVKTQTQLHNTSLNGKPSTNQHSKVVSHNPPKKMNETERFLRAFKISRQAVDDTYAQFNIKKDVLPIVAFIDTRPRNGHQNVTLILLEVRDVKRIRYNRVIGCGIDNITAKVFRVKPLFVYLNWIRSNVANLTHCDAIVTCYDLPSQNGSKAFVLYRPYKQLGLFKVYSERPVTVTRDVPTVSHPSIVVCSTVYDEPPWIQEWLRYQMTIGVDYIHLYAQESFVSRGGLNIPIVKQLIADNKLTVDVRKSYLTLSQVYYYSQPLMYQDCVLRYQGIYDFAMPIDTDDFFIPRVPEHTNIHYYLDLLIPKQMGSIKLDWVMYFPSCGLTTPLEDISDGNITHHLSTYKSYKQYVKSIHRLSTIREVAIHEVSYLSPGSRKGIASNSTAYFAHMRKTDGCIEIESVSMLMDNTTTQHDLV